MGTPQALKDLKELSTQIHTYGSALALLHWDQETYMPSGAIAARSQQIALLASLIHDLKTSRKFKGLLETLMHLPSGKIKAKGLSKPNHVCLREWRRDFLKADKLPTEFVKTFSQVTSEASQVWATAKKEGNFKLFAPFLGKILSLARKKAEILGFEEHPYDALLENYEPCMTTRRVDTIFKGLKKELMALLKKIKASPTVENRFLHGKVDEAKQLAIGHLLLSKLPMDASYSRLDLSAHPFSTGLHPHDSRITTRILPNAFMSNVFSVLHEAGHSMYEMGLPTDQWGTPLSEAVSLSIHESQSRWWETLIGRSLPFWKHFYPMIQKTLPSHLKKVKLKEFYQAIHSVTPSFIRVEADEVHSCLHVMLRFEIEKQLISGKLQVDELPDAWNGLMKEFFGITPPSDREGCLQDIHWSLGDFGYFPTYALGNLFAAHFFTAFAKNNGDWEERVAQGELGFVREWLKTQVHRWGKTYNAEELAKRVTGKPLNEKAY